MDSETKIQNIPPQATPPTPIASAPEQGSEIDPIRTETVFSRLPMHILSKTGPRPQINIVRRLANGKLEEKWEVSYNEKYGPAGQLAYDIHTLVIERAIEEAFEEARRNGQPFPTFISLKSLNEIANRLGADTRDTNRIKKALRQNAGILIDAYKKYRGNDGAEYTLEGTFSPYGIFFVGQRLPDGSKANEVLANLNDPYFRAWSNAPTRPLDYNYKAQLPPTPRRWYELISFAMYGAINNRQPTARYRYSEYCTRAPQLRYETFDQVKKQMYKVHRPHLKAGYITKVHYDQTTDEQGIADWWMIYNPGPRAFAEFSTFTGKKLRGVETPAAESLPAENTHYQRSPRQRRLKLEPAQESTPPVIIDYRIIAELGKRGVGEADARQLLATLPPGQPVITQLEWGDYQITQGQGKIKNPPGFYISLLQRNVLVPSTFETTQARKAREEAEFAKAEAIQKQREAALVAEAAETASLEVQLEALTEADRLNLLAEVKAEQLAKTPQMTHWLNTNPEATSFLHAGARQKIKNGWRPPQTTPESENPHYAINPEARQDTRLEVFSETLQAILTTPQLPAPAAETVVEPATAELATDLL